MEDQLSCLYAGPLSASAQRIVAALRAQYADRVDRSHSYLQRGPVNLYRSQSTWSQMQNDHPFSNRSWPKPYSRFQGESEGPNFASPTEMDSSPNHATPLAAWMESPEREPILPSFTQERDRVSPLQPQFSLCLDSPQNETSFHFLQPPERTSLLFHSPLREPPFPLPSPQRGSPFSSTSPLKETPLTPPSAGRDPLWFSVPSSGPRGAVGKLRMPQVERQTHRADHHQIQPEKQSDWDRAREQMTQNTHRRLDGHQARLHMPHTGPEMNQAGPHTQQVHPENHCKETRQQAQPDTHTRLENHQVDPDFCHTNSDGSQAGPGDFQTKPVIRTGSGFTDLQKEVEDKDGPPATSPVVAVPGIPGVRSTHRGWFLSLMPSREASAIGEQGEDVPSLTDPAKKWKFDDFPMPTRSFCTASPVNTAQIRISESDRQSTGEYSKVREESSEMEVDLAQTCDRGVGQEDGVLISMSSPGGMREESATVTASERGCNLSLPCEKSLIQVHAPCGGVEDTSAQVPDHPNHLLDNHMKTELTPNPQLPCPPLETDLVEAPSAIKHSGCDTLRHANQHESEADNRCDHGNQMNRGEKNYEGDHYKENAWFDTQTCMTEPITQGALSHGDTQMAEESQPEQKKQKISLIEGEEKKTRESRAGCGVQGPQRRLGVSSRALAFRAPPAARTPLHPSAPHSQALAGRSSGSAPPDRPLLTPTALEPPRITPPPSPSPRALRPPPDTPSQEPPLPRRPARWEPPRSSQGPPRDREERRGDPTPRARPRPPTPPAPPRPTTETPEPRGAAKAPHPALPPPPHRPLPPPGPRQQGPAPGGPPAEVRAEDSSGHGRRKRPRGASHRPAPGATNQKQAGAGPGGRQPGQVGGAGEGAGTATSAVVVVEAAAKPKPSLALTSDPRVCDVGRLSLREREAVLEEARVARALVLTLVFQDGSSQLDLEQKSSPSVCGILILLKRALDLSRPQQAEEEKFLFLRLEQKPAWVQQQPDQNHEQFTRELVLLVLSGQRQVVCYKAKDLLRTTLQHHTHTLTWKQMGVCEVLDPQIAAWLLDPADSAACFQELLSKHCRPNSHTTHTFIPAVGAQKVTHLISGLNHLYKLMVELRSKLQIKGLWQLYSLMEIRMIPVLAAMESHRIHVDRDALKKTSEMLGSKLKQLEQEAHQAAGQQFLVSSSNQLRLVLFEKLHLHERCENKKLPKTLLKQQQSTSEAVLLQLQDLHPLPKIILEYRQVHKIKSAFVDGILSCMNKTFISSTWNQTSAVSGRLSAKHPNFQALPKQPLQITKKQYVHGKEAELVTVHPRTMFIPRQGWTFLSADFCQVELRLLAHLSSDPELLRIFRNPDADVFTMLASQWKGIKEDSVSTEDREHAKRIVYSVVYGAGRERLSGILGVSAEQASRFQDSFLQTYKEVQSFIQRTIQQCQKQGYVVSIMGRRRSLSHIHSADWGARNQAERQAVNFVVQGSAADLCKMAMIRIFSQVASSASLTARLVAQIHDELLFEVEEEQLQEFALLVKGTMESLQHIDSLGVHLTVPLKVVVSSGSSWGSMSELSLPHSSPAR